MIIQPLKINFITKRKTGSKTLHTLFVRLSLGSSTTLISLKKDLDPKQWDTSGQRLKYKSPDRLTIDNLMHQYRNKASFLYNEALIKGIEPSIELIKDRITGSEHRNSTEMHLLEMMYKMIERKLILKGKNNTPATIQKYRRCCDHLSTMIQSIFKTEDIPFSRLNLSFVENFELHLRKNGCAHNSAMKYIQTLKSVVHHARAHGFIVQDPFLQFKIRIHPVERPYLTDIEIDSLLKFTPLTERLGNVRDIFIFSCFTGLAYIDVKELIWKNISKEGEKFWIRTYRQKTSTRTNIPLLQIAMEILQKPQKNQAQDLEKPIFKMLSNQKMNKYLKELALACNIKKRLTFHIARHTFATTITLSNGVPIESVSAMLGHKNLTTTQHYAKLIDKKLEEDMDKLSLRLLQLKIPINEIHKPH